MPVTRNEGRCPPEAEGRNIHAILFNGTRTREKSPQGWPATGRGACSWRISKPPHPFEIEFWELV